MFPLPGPRAVPLCLINCEFASRSLSKTFDISQQVDDFLAVSSHKFKQAPLFCLSGNDVRGGSKHQIRLAVAVMFPTMDFG